jgi:hypothetical protein
MSSKTATKILFLACLISFISVSLAAPHKQHHMKVTSHKSDVKDLAQSSQTQASVPPANGIYYIVVNGNGLCMEVPGAQQTNGVHLAENICNGQQNQQWNLSENVANGPTNYNIFPVNSPGLSIDLNNNNDNNGNYIQQWDFYDNPAQNWVIQGSVNTTINHDGNCWDIISTQQTDDGLILGTNLQIYNCDGGIDQYFNFIPVPSYPGPFTITSLASGLCLTVPGASDDEGTSLQILPCNIGQTDQQWSITLANAPGDYQIASVNSNLVLDVAESNGVPGITPGINIVQANSDNGNDQQWQIIPFVRVPGAFIILNVASNLTLSVFGYSTDSGAAIVQYPFGGDSTQLWNLNFV